MKSISEIESWLKEFSITNYNISDDFHITVYGNVNLNENFKGKKLPVNFKLVDGYFDISNNNLTSLEGCPETVTKDFNCSNNNLTSLLGSPYKVGDFDCSNNKLVNLSHCPKEVTGFFDCSNNQIVSIKSSPRSIKAHFKCSNNQIESLHGGPKYIDTYFDCSNNKLKGLAGGPLSVGQDYICNENKLADLDSVADEIGWDLITDVRLNHLTSSFNEELNYWKYKGSEVIAHIYKPIVALNNSDDIKKWLRKHDIKNFNVLKDNSVDVNGDVRLSNKLSNLLKLPLSFNVIDGIFDISDNELTSLEGCPNKVKGDFLAYKNELSSLKGGPKEVGGSFIVLQNNITSLKFSPSLVKEDFICSHNPLEDLDGINIVNGSVFTGVEIPKIKAQKYVYKGVATYKYTGLLVAEYLDKAYISLTDEEKAYEKTRNVLYNGVSKMIEDRTLTKEMITETFIKNLTKYHLDTLVEKVLFIKNPPKGHEKDNLSEEDIMNLAFDSEL